MARLQRYLPGNLVYRPVIQDLFISLHPFYFIIILAAKTATQFVVYVRRVNYHTTEGLSKQ